LADICWDGIDKSARQTGLLSPAFCLLVFGLASRPAWIAGSLSIGGLVLLGEVSYGIYLLHIPLLFWFDRLTIPQYDFRCSPPVYLGHRVDKYSIYLFLVVMVSWACYRWIETPARKLIRNRWAARQDRRGRNFCGRSALPTGTGNLG
jgi:peptidoglycan/LPS O-acetylase OafA/YrhL